MTVLNWKLSTRASSTPAIVTVCVEFQLADVKVSVAGETDASVTSLLLTVRITSSTGSEVSTTVKSSVEPASLTSVPPSDSTTEKPAMSSSVVTALTT